jgi:hypothetical protein
MSRWKLFRRALQALVVAALAAGVWGFVYEPQSLTVREYDLPLDRWPSKLEGLRVAVLADLHVGSPFNGLSKLEEIIQQTNQVEPDLILLAGDYVIQGVLGGNFVAPTDFCPLLGELRAPLGVWAVLGNHDWWLDGPAIRTELERNGIRVLENSAALIDPPRSLWLAGVSDYWEGKPDIQLALESVPPEAMVIVFTHNPDLFPQIPDRGALSIAGHTHGGQVRLPFIGRPIVPSQFGERYAAGHVAENGRDFFVSTGLGTSILPIRFGVPPEVSVLRLRAR